MEGTRTWTRRKGPKGSGHEREEVTRGQRQEKAWEPRKGGTQRRGGRQQPGVWDPKVVATWWGRGHSLGKSGDEDQGGDARGQRW